MSSIFRFFNQKYSLFWCVLRYLFYSNVPYCIFAIAKLLKETSQKMFQAKHYHFMLNILNKYKYEIQSPNKRAVSCLEIVYHTLLLQGKEPEPRQTKMGWGWWRAATSTMLKWMNLPADGEQRGQTHLASFPFLTLTSQQQSQTLRHLAFQSLKAATLALIEIWVLTARH